MLNDQSGRGLQAFFALGNDELDAIMLWSAVLIPDGTEMAFFQVGDK